MIVLGWDLESTGLDTANDSIIEIGAIVYDTENKVPLDIYSQLIRLSKNLPDDYMSPTGIKGDWLGQYGKSIHEAFGDVQKIIARSSPACVIAHNGENFDKPLTFAELDRANIVGHSLAKMHWLDPRTDINFKKEPASRSLTTLAAEHGFINPFPHRAIFDVITMLKLLDHYDFKEVFEESQKPRITVRALASFDTRQKAKDLRYSWNGTIWTKIIKESDFKKEQEAAMAIDLKIVVL